MESAGLNSSAAGISIPAGLTYEEFLEWADEDVHAEWVDGEIRIMSPASQEHQECATYLAMLVRGYVDEHSLGTVLSPPFQMKCLPSLPGREPDLLFVAQANLGRIRRTFIDGPADLVVEIVSAESRTRDTIDKLREYESGGVAEYWIIDPHERRAAYYRRNAAEKYEEQPQPGGVYRSQVIERFWLKTGWIWTRPKMSVLLKEWGIT